MKKKFALILAGSGVYDGAEIHEATMTMLAIIKSGNEYELFAPNIEQHHVINHLTGEVMNEKRNVLIEAARIARGKIKDLKLFDAQLFDSLIFPGGFGVAKNLSDFAFKGSDCKINIEIESAIKQMHQLKKPIGAMCISPAIMAKLFKGVSVTVGSEDDEAAKQIIKMGSFHEVTNNGEVIIDKKFNIFSTPCYMLDANILDIANGTENLINAIIDFIDNK